MLAILRELYGREPLAFQTLNFRVGSQVTHFFFEGCRYWTPIRSTPSQIKWRSPVWVTAHRSDEHAEHAERFSELVNQAVPAGATVLVVSRGEGELVQLDGREGWHFPRATYLALPDEALWWLDHYQASPATSTSPTGCCVATSAARSTGWPFLRDSAGTGSPPPV